jgi:hypothetical protein
VGTAIAGAGGAVTVSVGPIEASSQLVLIGPGGVASPTVEVGARDPVRLTVAAISATAASARLIAASPDAQAGDQVILQTEEGGTWVSVARGLLGSGRRAAFTVKVRAGGAVFRVVLKATDFHIQSAGSAVSVSPTGVAPSRGA